MNNIGELVANIFALARTSLLKPAVAFGKAEKLIEADRRAAKLEVLLELQTWPPGEGMGGKLSERIDNMIAELEKGEGGANEG